MKKILLVILSTLAFSYNASAIDWYVGASLGNTTYDSSGSLSGLTSYDDKDTSMSFTWGMPVEEFFNVEFTYSDFGDIAYNRRQIGVVETISFSQNPTSLAASAVFNYPLTNDIKLAARAGYEKWDVSYDNNGGSFLPESTETSGYSPFYGVGLSYNLSNAFQITGDFEHHYFDLGDNEITFNNLKVGVRYFY